MADFGDTLAGMSRGGNVLQDIGYDPEEVRANPALRAEVMAKMGSPLAAAPVQVAQNSAPPNPRQQAAGIPPNPNPMSPNGNSLVPAPGQPRLFNRVQPTAPPAPPPASLAGPQPPTTPQSMATGKPAVSPSVAPSGNNPDITNARTAVGNLLAPEPALPDTTADDATIAAKSAAINPDQKQYKEGFWGEVGRGLNDARLGFAGRPQDETPYGAPNEQYRTDDAQRRAQLGTAQTDRTNILDKFKQMSDQRKVQDAASKDAGTISNTTADIPIKQQTADADTSRAATEATKVSYESPEGKAAAITAETDARKVEGKILGLKGAELERYSLGKTGEQFAPNDNIIAAQQATRAFIKENGHPPQTLDEINSVRQAAQGKLGAAEAPGDTSKTGADYLATLSPDIQKVVKATANGDILIPSPSSRSPQAQAVRQAVMNYDPSFTDARYKGKQQFKTGPDSNDIVSLSTAMQHLEDAKTHSGDVGFALLLGKNATAADTKYNKDMELFSHETGKLIKSGVVTKEELEQLQGGLNSTRQGIRDAALDELTTLLGGKVSAKFQKYKTDTGQDLPVGEFFDKPTQDRLQRFGVVGGTSPQSNSGGAVKPEDYPEAK